MSKSLILGPFGRGLPIPVPVPVPHLWVRVPSHTGTALASPYLRGSARAKTPSFFPRSASLPFSGKAKEMNELGKQLPLACLLAGTPDAAWSPDTGEGDRVLGAPPGSSPPAGACPTPSTPPSPSLCFLASHRPSTTREEHCPLATRI